MNVTVKLFATLRGGRFEKEVRQYPGGTTIEQVIDQLGLPREKVSIIFKNNRHAAPEDQIAEGDIIAFFPPIGGG